MPGTIETKCARVARPGRLLLVYDDPREGRRLARWLREGTECDVTVAFDLRTGWSLRASHSWAAVLCSDRLSDGDGMTLLAQSRLLEPDTPTVLLSDARALHLTMEQLDYVDAHVRPIEGADALVATLVRLAGIAPARFADAAEDPPERTDGTLPFGARAPDPRLAPRTAPPRPVRPIFPFAPADGRWGKGA